MPKLSALRVEQISELGMYGDGQGLYLCVDRSGKRWVYRYIDSITGKRKVEFISLSQEQELSCRCA